jgi:hypothetical protein
MVCISQALIKRIAQHSNQYPFLDLVSAISQQQGWKIPKTGDVLLEFCPTGGQEPPVGQCFPQLVRYCFYAVE